MSNEITYLIEKQAARIAELGADNRIMLATLESKKTLLAACEDQLTNAHARIAELEAERDKWHYEFQAAYVRGTDAELKLSALRRKIDELEAWQQLAFEAHPNLDLDIEFISKEDLQK